MVLSDIEKFIKNSSRENIRISPRVADKLRDRGLDRSIIVEHLVKGEYEGVIKQDDNEYVIITAFNQSYDLITIIRKDSPYISIKTAFPQDKKRRFKRGWR